MLCYIILRDLSAVLSLISSPCLWFEIVFWTHFNFLRSFSARDRMCLCRDKTSSSLDRTKNRTTLSFFFFMMKNDASLLSIKYWILGVLNLHSLCFQFKIIFFALHLSFNFFSSLLLLYFLIFFWLFFLTQKFHLEAVGYLIFRMHTLLTERQRERDALIFMGIGICQAAANATAIQVNCTLQSARRAQRCGLQNRTESQWALRLRQRPETETETETAATEAEQRRPNEAQVQVNVSASASAACASIRLDRKRAHACCRRQCLFV